ncbi:hypothetical protein Q6297_29575, partial [Klebsiella pneumoniae]|nr:hypothetical protein [Klebsiella pneumoniae]
GLAASSWLNAANEVSVAEFLHGVFRFSDIGAVNLAVLDKMDLQEPQSIDVVLEARSINVRLPAFRLCGRRYQHSL